MELSDDGVWHILEDNRSVAEVAERSLRKTIVYRARCFRDEAEQARYHDSNPTMPTETILGRLRDDMVKRGVVHDGEFHAGESAQRRLEFAMKLRKVRNTLGRQNFSAEQCRQALEAAGALFFVVTCL